jgi:hypothetical protein
MTAARATKEATAMALMACNGQLADLWEIFMM